MLACITYLASHDEKSSTQLHLRTAKASPRQHQRKAKRDPSEYCGLLKSWRKVAQRLPGPTAYMAKQERQRDIGFFDTDAKVLKIDNCTTRSISNDINDFIDVPKATDARINGIGGSLPLMTGTIRWRLEDNGGQTHTVILPGSYYVKESPACLLSPQHWAQVSDQPDGVWCTTGHEDITLHWNGGRNQRTVKLDPRSNVGSFTSAPSYTKFAAFMARIDDDSSITLSYDANVISDDDSDDSSSDEEDNLRPITPTVNRQNPPVKPRTPPEQDVQTEPTHRLEQRDGPIPIEFILGDLTDTSGKNRAIDTEEEDRLENPTAEFLRWHHRLNHLPTNRIKQLAHLGILPKRLATCRVPICTSCLYGKATRRPWRNKPSRHEEHSTPTITTPGQCISVDQLESPTAGLIAQLKGTPTTERYRAATVFVDHWSDITYVYPQTSTNAKQTIEAKEAFERYASRHGVTVRHYQADNGRFAEHAFRRHAEERGQTLSYSGVNAHFQNGIAEKRIRDTQDAARTMLLHASRRWPEAIEAHLWPYALRMAAIVRNETPAPGKENSPRGLFTGTDARPTLRNWHHFGCPAYVLRRDMQQGRKADKWGSRANVGIYLGPSPQHANNVGLILSLSTGLTSPQFHVKYDSEFATVRGKNNEERRRTPKRSKGTTMRTPTNETTEPEQDTGEPLFGTHDDMTIPGSIEPEGGDDNSEIIDTQQTEPEITEPTAVTESNVRRSTRIRNPSRRLLEYHESHRAEINNVLLHEPIDEDQEPTHPLSYAASADPDTMYYHQAMREPDRKHLLPTSHARGSPGTLRQRELPRCS